MHGWKFLMIPFLAWAIAQMIKFGRDIYHHRRISIERLVGTGGMPSSHASFSSSLALEVGRVVGWESPVFAVACGFALIVMYDAAGLRRSVGRQAKLLNTLVEDLFAQRGVKEEKMRELLGHTPFQVVVGAVLGAVVVYLFG